MISSSLSTTISSLLQASGQKQVIIRIHPSIPQIQTQALDKRDVHICLLEVDVARPPGKVSLPCIKVHKQGKSFNQSPFDAIWNGKGFQGLDGRSLAAQLLHLVREAYKDVYKTLYIRQQVRIVRQELKTRNLSTADLVAQFTGMSMGRTKRTIAMSEAAKQALKYLNTVPVTHMG
jgi:hypothetical protein